MEYKIITQRKCMNYVLHTSSVVWEGEGNSNSKTCCKLAKIESYSLLKINNILHKSLLYNNIEKSLVWD